MSRKKGVTLGVTMTMGGGGFAPFRILDPFMNSGTKYPTQGSKGKVSENSKKCSPFVEHRLMTPLLDVTMKPS